MYAYVLFRPVDGGGGGGGGFEGVCLNTPFGPQKVFLTGNKNALNFANMARAIAWHLQGS